MTIRHRRERPQLLQGEAVWVCAWVPVGVRIGAGALGMPGTIRATPRGLRMKLTR